MDPGVPCVHHTTPLVGVAADAALKEVIVFEAVPAMSELIVTGEKEGFRSSTLAVTTGAAEEDTTVNYGIFGGGLSLVRASDAFVGTESANPDPSLGDINFYVYACIGFDCIALAGASVSLTDVDGTPAGDPLYLGDDAGASQRTSTVTGNAFTRFVKLTEGEYVVTVQHPDAQCRVDGSLFGNPIRGFAAPPNEVRVPVLLNHSTRNIAQQCFCDAQFLLEASTVRNDLDPGTCALRDGGARD